MAVLSVQNPTLLDLAQMRDPDGKIADVVEILNETNPILMDMSWVEGNLATGNKTSVRTGIPGATWRKMYGGVQPNKSTVATITDNTGMLEQYAEVDKALADLSGDVPKFRMQEDKPHIEGMNQEMVNTLFYGNEGTEPEAFTGLSPRYNDLSAENADNIIVGGGSGADNASIWLIVWAPQTIHGIIPKGSIAGMQVTDKGQVTIEDASDGSNTGRMEAYRTHYKWDAGLTLRDWRYAVRIPNIDKSALSITYDAGVFSGSSAHLANLMFEAMYLIPNLSMGRPVFYMSRSIITTLRQQLAAAVQGSTLTVSNVGGVFTESFQGIPIRRTDALAADEAVVS